MGQLHLLLLEVRWGARGLGGRRLEVSGLGRLVGVSVRGLGWWWLVGLAREGSRTLTATVALH